jgi:UDP-N-acetylmuramate dehydrogenase
VLIILGGQFTSVTGTMSASGTGATVTAGAGCPVSRLVGLCIRESLSGLEFMSGIPGSVGGAVRMNAGAWGSEIGAYIKNVSFLDAGGTCHEVPGSEIDFSYRRMTPKDGNLGKGVILGVELSLFPGSQREIVEKCREYQVRRREKQPLGVASAGSFFRNPEGDSAGRLIEAAGLKGMRKGNAMVSVKHANFIVNTGEATADDIVWLMNEIRHRVFDFSGIMLEPEVHVL